MATEERNRRNVGTLCCVAGAMSWGFSGACSEAFFRSYAVDPAWVTAIRMTAAGVLLLAWVLARRSVRLADIWRDRIGLVQLIAFSLAGLALCQFAYLNAIRWTNSSTATVLQNLSIVFVAVIVLVGTVEAFTLFLLGISLVGLVKASLLACLEPLTAAALSALWLHSTFSIPNLIGFACILTTVFLLRE